MDNSIKKMLNIIFSSVLLFSFFFLVKPSQIVHAAGTTYYIDNQAGSNCSNAGAGTSSAAPWCDFTNVNSHTFVGGDQILLARGSVWNTSGGAANNQLNLHGSGTSWSNFIL